MHLSSVHYVVICYCGWILLVTQWNLIICWIHPKMFDWTFSFRETTNWQQIQKLVSHQLTVTQLAFSPDSQKLVSVSRDRRWTLFQRREGSNHFDIAASSDKTNGVHSRIIWCCAWAHDSSMFATGSRDGKVSLIMCIIKCILSHCFTDVVNIQYKLINWMYIICHFN